MRILEFRISKRIMLQSLAAFFLIFYSFTSGLQTYIYQNYLTILGTFGICLLIMFVYNAKKVKVSLPVVLVLAMLVVMLENNRNIPNGYYDSLFYTVTVLLFYIFAAKSNEWHDSVISILKYAGLFYAFMTVFLMLTPSIYKNIVNPLFASSGYSEQMMALYDQGYMPGFTPHYSTNGMYLAIGLGIPFAFLITGLRKKDRKKYFVYFVLILMALLLTGKRAHTVFAVVSLLFCYYFMNCDKPLGRWFKIVGLIAIGALGIVLVSEFVPGVLNVVKRFAETMAEGRVSMGRDIWRAAALKLFMHNKLFGIGWDGFRYFAGSNLGVDTNIHCVYVQLLCETGLVGSLPYFTFFVLSIYQTISATKYIVYKKDLIPVKGKLSLMFSLYMQCFFLLYCITGNPLYDAPTLIPYMMACAMGEYYYSMMKQEKLFEES